MAFGQGNIPNLRRLREHGNILQPKRRIQGSIRASGQTMEVSPPNDSKTPCDRPIASRGFGVQGPTKKSSSQNLRPNPGHAPPALSARFFRNGKEIPEAEVLRIRGEARDCSI